MVRTGRHRKPDVPDRSSVRALGPLLSSPPQGSCQLERTRVVSKVISVSTRAIVKLVLIRGRSSARQGALHGAHGLSLHVGEYVGLGAHCDGDARVPEHLLHYSRAHGPGEEDGGAGVPEVVEADVRHSGGPKEGLEGAADEVRGLQGSRRATGTTGPGPGTRLPLHRSHPVA